MASFTINGEAVDVDVVADTPLVWVIREHLKLTGTKFSCGAAQCGSCMVHMNGDAVYSCVTPVSAAEGQEVTTIEGLSDDLSHPLQKAWIDEEAPQCGFCQSGQIMKAATLLAANKNPSRQEIVEHMHTNLCRCGTYKQIIAAIERAAREV
jgi:isoquinoline 1-oxidoreductase alpha subunit